jgi:hypothetical protein
MFVLFCASGTATSYTFYCSYNRDPVLNPAPAQRSCAAVLEAAVHEEKTRQKEILTT